MSKYQEALDGIIEGNVKFSETVDLMFFIITSIKHNKQLGDNLKKQCLDYVIALANSETKLQELVDKATQVKPPTYEEIEKACDYLGYDVSFNHYDNGMRLKLFNRLTLDSMTVFTNGDIAFTSNPEMYGIKKEFSQLHCLIIRYLESRKGE